MQRFNRLAWLVAPLCALLSTQAHSQRILEEFTKGATSRSVELLILDNATGLPATGLTFGSSGIDLEYCREATACVDITEVTQTVGGAWTSGGFVDKGKGVYRLDVPNLAFATGVNSVTIQGDITGYTVVGGRVKLVNINTEDAVRGGMTGIPNATPGAAGGVLIAGSNADFDVTANASFAGGVTITQSSSNLPGLSVAGNGSGPGLLATGGATAPGFFGVGGSTSGLGFASSITTPSGSFVESGMMRSGSLTGTHSATTADLGTNAPTRDISCMTVYFPDHDLSKLITSYNTGTGVATFSTTTETLINGDDWTLYGTPCGAGGFPTVADIWSHTTRELTSGNNIALTKGTGVLGFNDLNAAGVENAVWNAAFASHVTAGTAGLLQTRIPNAAPGGTGGLPTVDSTNRVAGVSGNVAGSVASVAGNVGGSVASVVGNLGGNVSGNVNGTVALSTASLDAVQARALAALNAWTIDGELTTDLICRMAAALYGAAATDVSGDGSTVFSNAAGTETRLTIAYGTDEGDRNTVTLGASCGP